MKFEKVHQKVFHLSDIKTLVETLRVESNENMVLVFDLEAHAQRLLTSILKLSFKLPCTISHEDFALFLLNQIKNKLQYEFHKAVSFTKSERDESLKLMRLSNDVYKLRLIYKTDGSLEISIEAYNKDLEKIWQVLVLKKEDFYIESSNPIWQHKFFPRPDFSYFLNQGYDEVLWLDENGNVCEGSFTAIVFDDSKTPLANNLPSISIEQIPSLTKIQCKIGDLQRLQLVNSLIGAVDACIINHK